MRRTLIDLVYEAQDEIQEMKRKFKFVNHQIEQLEEEINTKDKLDCKYYYSIPHSSSLCSAKYEANNLAKRDGILPDFSAKAPLEDSVCLLGPPSISQTGQGCLASYCTRHSLNDAGKLDTKSVGFCTGFPHLHCFMQKVQTPGVQATRS